MEYHEVTGQQKGALGEALFSVSHGPKEIIASWIYHDLHQHENLTPTSPQELSIHRCGRENCKFHHCDPFDDKPGWFPDFHFYVLPHSDNKPKRENRMRVDYLLEIKTGSSSTLSRTQRDVMEYVERTNDGVVPVRVRVDISRLPDEYGVKFTRVHEKW